MEQQLRSTGEAGFLSRVRFGALLVIGAGLLAQAAPAAAASFATQQTVTTGTGPRAVAAADLNADGKVDLVVANLSDATVSVFLNTTEPGATTASFATPLTFAVDKYPVALAIADLDGDGKPDLITANASSATLSILRNTTDAGATTPSFAAQQTLATRSYPYSVAAADIDGDGKLDIAVAEVGSGTVSVFRNSTAAGASAPTFDPRQEFAVGSEPASVAVADFNHDGKPDLIAVDYITSHASVLLNTTAAGASSVSFADKFDFGTSPNPVGVTVADLNGDGKPDAVSINPFGTATVYLNATASGSVSPAFGAAQEFTLGTGPASVVAADFDGDGLVDIVSANQSAASLSLLTNTTASGATTVTFATAQAVTTGSGPVSVAKADFNGDGKPDLVAANNLDGTVSVLINTTAFTAINPNQHGIAGSWFNPTTSGQGLEIDLYPDLNGSGNGVLFGGWFTYGAAAGSGQRWYALQGGVTSTSATALLGIYAGIGGNFAAPPVVSATQVGTATLTFTSCTSGTLAYSFFDGRTGSVPLARLTANVTCGTDGDNGNAASNYLLSGSWSDPALGGQGLVFDVNPIQNNFFAAWYTYAPDGAQTGGAAGERWYTIQAAFSPGDKSITGATIYATSGGIFDNATPPTTTPVGTASITFTSCSAATLTYSFTAGANAGLSGTINLARTGPTPEGCAL